LEEAGIQIPSMEFIPTYSYFFSKMAAELPEEFTQLKIKKKK